MQKRSEPKILMTSPQNDFILQGPPLGPIPDCSLGEYLIQKLRSLPRDRIIQVDADTGEEQTVGEFLTKSIRLSEGLKKLGLKKDDVVGILCRNCFEAGEIVLGTWLSGVPIAPLCGSMKVDEMKRFLELLKPKYIFCDEEAINNITVALNLLSMSSLVIFIPQTEDSNHSHMTVQDVLAEADVDNYKPQSVESPSTQLVGILPSSGSSGPPKAVGLTHKNLIFQDLNMEFIKPFNEGKDYVQISPFFWVTGILMFLKSVTSGMKRILLRDPNEINILKATEQYKPKWTLMAPLLTLSIVSCPEFEKFDVSSLKTVAVGGSPFTPNIGKKLLEKWEGVRFIQCYGTTEASGCISVNCDQDDIYSVGKVTPEVQIKFIDTTTGKSLKSNHLGEIWVKSPGIMRGYFQNEEATREAVDTEGWLHTGDLGYYDDLGQVYLVDRIKEMVKVMNMQAFFEDQRNFFRPQCCAKAVSLRRGADPEKLSLVFLYFQYLPWKVWKAEVLSVAPVEVEDTIISIPSILEACVTGVSHDGNLFELLAFVVKEKNSTVTEEDIHAHVANTLSDYKKLTGGVYFVENLPKTPNGKFQRKEIRQMAQALYSKSPK